MKVDFFMDSAWEKILSLCLRNNIPFYIYRLPDSTKMVCGIQTDPSVVKVNNLEDVKGKSGFVMSPFDIKGEHPHWFIRSDIFVSNHEEIDKVLSVLEQMHFSAEEAQETVVVSERHNYMEQINSMLSDLRSGRARKAILSRIHLHKGVGRRDAPGIFMELAKCYDHAFVFLVNVPGYTTWMGASPETLLKMSDSGIFTMALAGTQAADERSEDEVFWQQKEVEEQGIVSEYVEMVFKRFDLRRVKKSGPFTLRAGNVFHLNTEYLIDDELSQNQINMLIEQLHPTPAVCGLPKEEAKEIISQIEPHDREYYAGFLGPVQEDGCCSLFVNLRSMKVMKDEIALFVGGGITVDSVPENEWQETCLKARTLLKVVERVVD